MELPTPGTADVLSSGREPWRPSGKQVLLTASVLAVLAAMVVAGVLVTRQVNEVRADRRDVKAMSFTAYVKPDDGAILPQDTVRLELINQGADHVRVLDVRIDGPGYARLPVNDTFSRNGGLTLSLSTKGACAESLYTHGPQRLIVRARTMRGTTVTARAPLEDDFSDQLWGEMRGRCGILLADEALTSDHPALTWRDGILTASYRLSNRARLPLVLDSVTSVAGVAVDVGHLPLTLPASAGDDAPSQRTLVIRLHVTSCTALHRAFDAAVGGGGLDGPNYLQVALHHRYGKGHAALDLDQFVDANTVIDRFGHLVAWCDRRTR